MNYDCPFDQAICIRLAFLFDDIAEIRNLLLARGDFLHLIGFRRSLVIHYARLIIFAHSLQVFVRRLCGVVQDVLFTLLQLRKRRKAQLAATFRNSIPVWFGFNRKLSLGTVRILLEQPDGDIRGIMLSREAGYFVAKLHRAAGTVLGRYRNPPIGIVAAVFVAPPAAALVLVVREFLFDGQIRQLRFFWGNLQLHMVSKDDLAVRGRGEVRFGFEGQYSVKGCAAADPSKVHRDLAVSVDAISAHRCTGFCIFDHVIVDLLIQFQSARQLIGHRAAFRWESTFWQIEFHHELDGIAILHRFTSGDVYPLLIASRSDLLLECYAGDMFIQRLHRFCRCADIICGFIGQQCHRIRRDPRYGPSCPDHKRGLLVPCRFHAVRFLSFTIFLCLISCGQIDHIRDLVRTQGHLGHLAVHVAGDHGQGAGIRVHIRHDAHGLGADGALLGLGLSSHRLQRKQGNVCIGRIIHDLRRVLFHRHRLGGDAVVEHDIAGHKLDLCRRLQPLGPAQVAAQGLHTGALRHHGLRHIRVVQAVGQEHHIPRTVGVAIPCTVTGVVAHGGLVLIVQPEVALTLLVTQLAFCHSGQVVGPRTGEHNIRLCAPCLLVLHIRQRVGQAVHGVVVLRQAADQHFLIAGVGVVVHRGVQTAVVHNGLKGHGIVKHRRGFLIHRHIVRVGLLHKLALFQTAHQLIFNGIAAVVVGVLEQVTDQAAILGVKAVIGVHMLFLVAGQRFHFLIAVVGVLVGHKNVLRLRLCRIGGNVGIALLHTIICIRECAVVRLCGVPVLRFALLIAAHQHLLIALGGVLVLDLAALVVCRLGNAHTVQLPVNEQAGEQRQCQQQCHIPPRCLVFPAELLHQCRCDILHAFHPHYTKSSVFSSFAKPPNPRPVFILP